LYLSNFIWKVDGISGQQIVKIIDFDSAHMIEDRLSDVTISRLVGIRHQLAEREPGGANKLRNYDISLMLLPRENAGVMQLRSIILL